MPKIHHAFRWGEQAFESAESLLLYAQKIDKEAFLFLQNWFDSTETVQLKTSGSTGAPKTISLVKTHMKASAKATGAFFSLGEGTKALICLSASYIAGKMMFVRAMELGWHIEVKAANCKPLIESNSTYDFAAMVPLQVQNNFAQLHQIKKVLIGGAPVSPSLYSELQKLETLCYASYGMTETASHIAIKKLNHTEKDTEEVYHALENITLEVDQRSCLRISSPNILSAPIQTNDIIHLKSPSSFEWLGRYDSIINSGGIKIVPEHLERILSKHIQARFFIYGEPDETLGERVVLFIEGKGPIDTSFFKKLLPNYQIPKQVYYISAFVETPTGKVNRKQTFSKR